MLSGLHKIFETVKERSGVEHWVKSVRIRSFSGPCFPVFITYPSNLFSRNAEKYGLEKLRIRALFTQWNFPWKVQQLIFLISKNYCQIFLFRRENGMQKLSADTQFRDFVTISFLVRSYILTHLLLMHPFSTPWKHQKIVSFCNIFRLVRKMGPWKQMAYVIW